jgi:hypothetical protein
MEGSSGPTFETDTLLRIEAGEMRKCEKESGLMSLEATYEELVPQQFVIRCIHRPPCCKCEKCECFGLGTMCREGRGLCREEICVIEIPLTKLAKGSVQQCIQIAKAEKGKGKVWTGGREFFLVWFAGDLR